MLNAVWRLERPWQNILALYLIFTGQIVFLSQVLSELHTLSGRGYLIGHVIILIIALLIWNYVGRPALWFTHGIPRHSLADLLKSLKAHPMLWLYALGIGIGMGTVLVLRIDSMVLAHDGLTTHLVRPVYWLTNGTAQHFHVNNFHIIDYPPNASFQSMWLLALSGNYNIMFLPHWVAACLAVLATAALARLAGFSWPPAIFAGLTYLSNAQIMRQIYDGQIDHVVTLCATILLIFLLQYIQALATRKSRPSILLAYAAVSFGLMAGSKLTGPMILPGMGLVLAIYTLFSLRSRAVKPLMMMATWCLAGFLLFGSYNYILNYLDFGNPITSLSDPTAEASVLLRNGDYDQNTEQQFFNRPANFVRNIYVMASFGSFESIPGLNRLQPITEQLFRFIDRSFDLQLDSVPLFSFSETPNTSFGLTGFLAVMLAPFFFIFSLLRVPKSSQAQMILVYLSIALIWMIVIAVTTSWSPGRVRLFTIIVPLLFTGIMPYLYWPRRFPFVALPIMLLAIIPMNNAITKDLIASAPILEWDHLVRDGDRIGILGTENRILTTMARYPQATYHPVPPLEAPELLRQGELDLILAQRHYCEVEGGIYQYLPQINREQNDTECIYAPPERFIDPASMQASIYRNEPALIITSGSMLQFDRDTRMLLPTEQLLDIGGSVLIQLQYDGYLRPTDIDRVTCNEQPIDVSFTNATLWFMLDRSQIQAERAVQPCEINFINRNQFEAINENYVTLRSLIVSPAPGFGTTDEDADYRIDDRIDMLAWSLPEGNDVRACEYLEFQSWWQLDEATSNNYQLSVTLVDAAGQGQAQADAQLAYTPTSTIAFGENLYDWRFIPIPCDTPAGTYSLIVSLYDLDTLNRYPVSNLSGDAMGDFVYLTNVTVK